MGPRPSGLQVIPVSLTKTGLNTGSDTFLTDTARRKRLQTGRATGITSVSTPTIGASKRPNSKATYSRSPAITKLYCPLKEAWTSRSSGSWPARLYPWTHASSTTSAPTPRRTGSPHSFAPSRAGSCKISSSSPSPTRTPTRFNAPTRPSTSTSRPYRPSSCTPPTGRTVSSSSRSASCRQGLNASQ